MTTTNTTPSIPSDFADLLQAACDVELWTIALYLTAAYSIQDGNSPVIPIPTEQDPTGQSNLVYPQELLLSVAIQEMYHLQLAANLAAAFGVTPELNFPVYNPQTGIPHLTPLNPLPANMPSLGSASDVIDLLIAIETPDPNPPSGPNAQGQYKSIGDLYFAIENLVNQYQSSLSPRNQLAATAFTSRYSVNTVQSYNGTSNPNTAVNAIRVIKDEGEGRQGDTPQTSLDDDAYTEPAPGTRFYTEDHASHYWRFVLLKQAIDAGNVTVTPLTPFDKIPNPTPAQLQAQSDLEVVFAQILHELRTSWQAGNQLNLEAMWLFQGALKNVVGMGMVPRWNQGSDTDYPAVSERIDPYWSERQPAVLGDYTPPAGQTYFWHACQGLNECAMQGSPNTDGTNLSTLTGSMPGDGFCATVVPHTCSNGNACKGQGGGAFAGHDPAWNTCDTKGGCQAPISPQQVFETPATFNNPLTSPPPITVSGDPVWLQARMNVQQRLQNDLDQYLNGNITDAARKQELAKILETAKQNGLWNDATQTLTLACPTPSSPPPNPGSVTNNRRWHVSASNGGSTASEPCTQP